MRSEARLDSAVFQLTPTRTRCDLVIIANGKKEKLASGLLTPFLAHLKTAQDQIAKGGYSITLEPDPEIDATWFTKGTVERFVRFVSTPELLERVTTIESEILQIDNAIAIQSNDNLGPNNVEDHRTKTVENGEGIKSSADADAGKAIVLYKPGSQSIPPDSNGSVPQEEENSKLQLLKVLETRKMVLRKEQGMAFARAIAAGFDLDNLEDLIPFCESFGASRLKEACLRFTDLWKKKHETGQWLEVEAVDAMSTRSEFAAINASGIIFTADSMIQKDHMDAQSVYDGHMFTDSDGKTDKQMPSEPKVSLGNQEHFQGQFQHPTYPQWAMHPPPGPPMFQPYPMQGMPYYQNYPGGIPYFHPPYPPTEDHRFNSSRRKDSKRHSMDSKDIESESWERSIPSQDDTDENTSDHEKESSHGRKSHKKVGRSGKKKSSVVVIRNINYVASKKHGAGNSESDQQSASESEAEEESEHVHSDVRESKHKHSTRTSKKEDGRTKHVEYSDVHGTDKATYGEEADSGNWQAFQSFLLQAEEKSQTVNEDMFMGEKEPPSKKRQSKGEADPIVPQRDYGDFDDHITAGFDSSNGNANRIKQKLSDDPLLVSSNGRDAIDNQFKEIESVGGAYRRMSNDEFMIYEQEKQFSGRTSSDPLIDPSSELAGNAVEAAKSSSYNITDDSFMLPYRFSSQEFVSDNITVIDMDSEIPTAPQKAQDSYDDSKNQIWYEPDDLSMVPDRGMESLSIGYDPAMDYDFEISVVNTVKLETGNQEDISTTTKEEPQKSDKERNLKASNDSVEKRRKDALARRGTSSRLNSLAEAQKRAEKLRSYKVDLQKVKKEREEEARKRIEALKMERQKRIAARSGSTFTQSPSTPQQTKPRLATRSSPSPYKESKFSDVEPASSSPLRKLPARTSLNGSSDTPKVTKSSISDGNNHGLTRLTSSLPDSKKERNGLLSEAKTDSARMKRYSDPKNSSNQHASSVKSVTTDQIPKRSTPDGIVQLDESKSATPPELRIKIKTSSDRVENGTVSKEPLKKEIGSKTSQVSDSTDRKSTNGKSPSNSDENPVIEKTVVMLEDNVITAPIIQQSEEMIETRDRSHEVSSVTRYAAIHAPPSPVVITQAEDSGESKLDEQQSFDEVVVPYSKNEPPKSSDLNETAKSYEAPYARVTSLEEPVTDHLENYDDGVPASESEMPTVHAVKNTLHMSSFENSSLEDQIHEIHDKPRSKETKGFRKLLKFGRKSHSPASGEGTLDSDASSVDDQTVSAVITNDVSRSFSLLSPFRSKHSEKKQAA